MGFIYYLNCGNVSNYRPNDTSTTEINFTSVLSKTIISILTGNISNENLKSVLAKLAEKIFREI